MQPPLRSPPPLGAVTNPPVTRSPNSPVTTPPVGSPPHQQTKQATTTPTPVTGSTVRSPPRQHNSNGKTTSFRSLLQEAEHHTASPVRSPPRDERKIGESLPLPLRMLLRDEAEDPTPSPPQNDSLALTVATIYDSPEEEKKTPAPMPSANRRVENGVGPTQVKRKDFGNGERRRERMVKKPTEDVVRSASGWLRISAVVLSLVSLSLMAADRTPGWAGDSFERYREFRYCFSVNVIVFVYSSFQVFVQVYWMCAKQHLMKGLIRFYFDLSMDQMLAYLLMSASSAAASRNDDWVLSFGSDDFTKMMDGSVAISFLAFFVLAFSSLISTYKLFTTNS